MPPRNGLRQQGHRVIVAVSHDWNIAAVREVTVGSRFEDVGWPQFLDGVVIDDDGVYCRHTDAT